MAASKRITGEAIWLDGDFVDWDAARVHVLTHTLHYGLGVFEGIRCYRTVDDRSAVFRLGDHVRRLFDSAHINLMQIPFSRAQIEAACLETLRRNHLAEGYLRPLVFIGDGEMGLNPGGNPIRVAVVAAIAANPLEDAEPVVQGVRQDMNVRLVPRDEFPIEPDPLAFFHAFLRSVAREAPHALGIDLAHRFAVAVVLGE